MRWKNLNPRERSRSAPEAFIEPCMPTRVDHAPVGGDWAHEIKHDGYRLQIHTGQAGVRLYTMSGYDWTDRFPQIAAAAAALRGSAIIDAEVAIARTDGVTDFEALHGRQRNGDATAYAFDLMMREGEDVRALPWLARRNLLKALLGRRRSGVIYNKEIVGRGPEVFGLACRMGLEGIVSKQVNAPYRSGRTKVWLKIKNREAPGWLRFHDSEP